MVPVKTFVCCCAGGHAEDLSGVKQSAVAVQTAVDTGKGGIFFGEGDNVQLLVLTYHMAVGERADGRILGHDSTS